jgi:hypothetical protein
MNRNNLMTFVSRLLLATGLLFGAFANASHTPPYNAVINYDSSLVPGVPVTGQIGWSNPVDGYDWHCLNVTAGQPVTLTLTLLSGSLRLNASVFYGIAAEGTTFGVAEYAVQEFFTHTSNSSQPNVTFNFTPYYSGPITVIVSTWLGDAGGTYQLVATGGTAGATCASPQPPAPNIAVDSASLRFGSQAIGTTSQAQTVVVTNSGTAALAITRISALGDFGFSSNCPLSPNTLAVNGSCNIDVTFTPLSAGGQQTFVYVDSNASNGSSLPIPISGEGTRVLLPGVAVTPLSLVFGDRVVGSSSITQVVMVSNPGQASLNLTGINLTGSSFVRSNIAPAGVTSPSCSTTLAPQADCFIGIVFTPSAVGAATGEVTITHNAPSTVAAPVANPIRVTLTGNGTPVPQPQIRVSGNLTFGDQIIGTQSGNQTITITNTGTAALSVSAIALTGANAGDFLMGGNCTVSINPNASCSLTVAFKPVVTGAKTAQVTVTSNAQNAGSISPVQLAGTGVPVPIPVIRVSATTVGFGNVTLGGTPASQGVTISNIGTGPLVILGLDITGNSDFSVSNGCSGGVAPQGNCNLQLTFTPRGIGARSGTLTIRSNALDSPHKVQMSGTGCRPFSPSAARFFVSSC